MASARRALLSGRDCHGVRRGTRFANDAILFFIVPFRPQVLHCQREGSKAQPPALLTGRTAPDWRAAEYHSPLLGISAGGISTETTATARCSRRRL